VDAALVGQFVAQAREQGLQLSGEGGLLQQLTKIVLESALDGEITDHLGYDKRPTTRWPRSGGRNRRADRSARRTRRCGACSSRAFGRRPLPASRLLGIQATAR
jgi:transposase-like protein